MLTKDDLQHIAEVLHPLIKAEGETIRKEMATKRDLEGMATKRDLENMASKSDLVGIATRSDLETSNRIIGEIFKIELAATRKEMIEAMKAGFREVVKILSEYREESEERIKELEESVRRIEKQASLGT